MTCENALFIIRNQNLEAEQENLKLTQDQRALNVKYQAYLSEAANVVITFNLLSAGRHKNPFNFSIDIVFFRTFEIQFKSKIAKC